MKKTIVIICKAYIIILALFLSYLGIQWGFMLEGRLASLNITAPSIPAINTLKSIMGTMLLSLAIFALLFLKDSKKWFMPMAIMIILIIAIRSISLLRDGYHERMAIYTFLEFLVLLALITVNKFENQKSSNYST